MDIPLFNWLLAVHGTVSSLICETWSSYFAQQNCTTKSTVTIKGELAELAKSHSNVDDVADNDVAEMGAKLSDAYVG
jgi:hypothetical protein